MELRRDDLLRARSYQIQMVRDVEVEPEDFVEAFLTLGLATREEFEPAWPTLDAMIEAILEAGKVRRIATSKVRAIGDGRLPGEDSFARSKRIYEFERQAGLHEPDADERERVARLNLLMKSKTG